MTDRRLVPIPVENKKYCGMIKVLVFLVFTDLLYVFMKKEGGSRNTSRLSITLIEL